MKKCSYCGKQAENDAVFCPSCGASDFTYICPNCGSVIEDGKFCSKCGVKADAEPKHCPECGNEYFTNACPNCGYTEINVTAAAPQNYGYTYRTQTEPVKPKRRTWLWVLGWIFIFSVPATILISRSRKLNKLLKIILIAAVWLLYIGWMGSSKAAQDADSSSAAFADSSVAAVVQYEDYGTR